MSFYTVDSLNFFYPKGNRLFHNLSFSIESDEHIGLIGPNGCGKTTLARLMLGILKPLEGELRLEGRNIKGLSLSDIGKEIGYVFQNPDKQLFCPTVSEQIGFSLKYAKKNSGITPDLITEHYLKIFDLMEYKDTSPLKLSRGEKQRVALASVLSRDVKFLILDEPASGLDMLRKRRLEECLLSLREEGRGYMIIGHEAEHISRYVNRIFFLGPEGVEIS